MWSPHHALTNTLVGLDLESQLKIIDHCWLPNDTIMQLLRLSSHIEWFHHPVQTYKKWLTNIQCSGWGYAGAPIMLLPPHLWYQIWKVSWKSLINDGCQMIYHHAVVEALSIHWMAPTSTPNIQKVIVKHYIQWMGIWSPHCAVTTKGTSLESQLKIIDHCCCWVPNDRVRKHLYAHQHH